MKYSCCNMGNAWNILQPYIYMKKRKCNFQRRSSNTFHGEDDEEGRGTKQNPNN